MHFHRTFVDRPKFFTFRSTWSFRPWRQADLTTLTSRAREDHTRVKATLTGLTYARAAS